MNEMQNTRHEEKNLQENFFLENFNVDRLFNLISRYDYLFLFHINKLMQRQKDRLVRAYEEITMTISQEELTSMGNTMRKITEIIKHTEN